MKQHKTVFSLLADKERWCRGHLAKGSQGRPCDPKDADAACFCLAGAVRRVYKTPAKIQIVLARLNNAIVKLFTRRRPGITEFNDYQRTKHRDILAVVALAKA